MTKVEYASIYAIIATIIMVFMVYIGRDADKKGIHVRRQLHLLFAMNVCYFVSFFVNDALFLGWNHSIVQIFETWISFMFVHFALNFTDSRIKVSRIINNLLLLIGVVDTAIILYNSITKNLYDFLVQELRDGSMYVYPNVNVYYFIHMGVCVLMQIIFIVIMVRKAIIVSAIYKTRYVALSVIFGIGLIMCIIMRVFGNFMNFPAVIILTVGESAIFDVYFHLPKIRINKMKNFVIKNVTMPILMFDYEDELQVINGPAKKITDVRKGDTLQQFIETNNLKYILTPERRAEGKTKEFTLTIKLDETAYLIHGQELWDEKNNFVGTLMIYNDITKQEALKEEATYHATRDSLTGLWNREYFLETTQKILDNNPDKEYAFIVSDIHQFKMFNEILGRKMGDDLLISVAQGFEERKKENWVFSRVSGDKFAMFMPKEDYDEERFLRVCNSIIEQREYALTVHFYLGVYFITDRRYTVSEMCDRAYMAMEGVRGSVKRNVAYYDEEIRNKMIHETINASDLDRALREKEFTIYLQPQVDTVHNKIVGCEALARWVSPKRGLIPPIEFVPAFEDNGMIAELDYYVWELACQTLRKWKDNGDETSTISVNISAKDFYLSDIYARITGLVEKYEISPKNLRLEITETAFVLNIKEQMALVEKLQKHGFIVEIDDFGSGYSSLNHLKDIKVDVLKLDMKFFEKTDDDDRAEKIIESVVNLAYNLKMPVIAEGVELKEQVEMLQRIGCKTVQGYYYSKPLPIEEYERFVEDFN